MYLFSGDDVSTLRIYEIINKYFGENYSGWMKAWYDINGEFAAWFPTITLTDERPNGVFGGTRNCSNTLSNDKKTICEIDHNIENPICEEIDDKYQKKRLVFARIDGKFEFLGIFERKIIICDSKRINLHMQIADGINLETFNLFKRLS
jgi:hypothetical protein